MPNRLDLFGFRERASDDSAHGSFLGEAEGESVRSPLLSCLDTLIPCFLCPQEQCNITIYQV